MKQSKENYNPYDHEFMEKEKEHGKRDERLHYLFSDGTAVFFNKIPMEVHTPDGRVIT